MNLDVSALMYILFINLPSVLMGELGGMWDHIFLYSFVLCVYILVLKGEFSIVHSWGLTG